MDKTRKEKEVKYLETRPARFEETKKYPIIIMLNGAGSRGDNLEILHDSTIIDYQKANDNFPFIVFSPLCRENTWFDVYERLMKWCLEIVDLPYIDKTRVYLSGASMGGYAAWQILQSLPKVFAAAMICCGGGMYWNAGRIKTPVWAFHGKKDTTVFWKESENMIAAVRAHGVEAKETYYEDVGHDCWSLAYRNDEVYDWLLAHKLESSVEN